MKRGRKGDGLHKNSNVSPELKGRDLRYEKIVSQSNSKSVRQSISREDKTVKGRRNEGR